MLFSDTHRGKKGVPCDRMGNQSAKPSTYVAKQWIDDRDSASCHMCCKSFSAPMRRRHHCRCCGEIFCADCWGATVKLPPDYGYTKEVPVCSACEALFHGKLKFLRRPRRIVLTRALKSNQSMHRPPLCEEFKRNRRFEVFFTKIAHWRPLNARTNLLFAVSMRTVNTNNSSYFNAQPSTVHAAVAVHEALSANRCSALDLDAMRQKRRHMADLSDDDEVQCSVAPSRSGHTTNGRHLQHGGEAFLDAPGPKRSNSTRLQPHVNGDVQLDVAWSLPLDAILSIALDAHPEGDFISVETHSEVYRVQVADAELVTAEQQQQQQHKAGVVGFRIGARPPAMPQEKSDDEEDENVLTSRPRKDTVFRLLPEETNGLFIELQDALRLMSERSRHRLEKR